MSLESPRRLHPISPFFDLIAGARQFLLPAGAAVVADQWWFLAPTVVVAILRCLSWFRFTYQVDGDVIRVNEGLITRTRRTIALDRVQQVDVVEKLRHRLFGVVGLHVDTASGAEGAELELEVVSRADAERLRALILRATPAATREEHDGLEVPATPSHEIVSLGAGQLAVAGMTGAQTLVILGALFSLREVSDFVDLDRLLRRVPDGSAASPFAIASAVVGAFVVWMGLAAAAMVFTHFQYRLSVHGDQFRVTRGLLDKREVGGGLARIQAVRVEQTLLRRALGFAALRVQTAAVPGQAVSRIVIPYVRTGDVERVVDALLPGTAPWPVLQRAPGPALRLALARRVPLAAGLSAPFAVALAPWGLLALGVVPLAVGAAVLHWHALGYAAAGDVVWARRGGLMRETVVVPAAKAQSLRQSTSPWQRRYELASLRIDIAGRSRSAPGIYDAPRVALDRIVTAVPLAARGDERRARALRLG